MASSGDRARYFLEQSIPELRELLQKEVFSKNEVSSITKKRSDFEHLLNARGSQPADYVRYIAYEQNLEMLKRKRMQRMGVKNLGYNGPRRTFFLFERATRKFPHDIKLWTQYLNYTKKQRAHKRLGKVITSVLRLHPTNSELWIYAAQYAMERHDSPSAARSYFQRALRFCPKERQVWVEYCRMEMHFIAKVTESLENMGVKKMDSNKSGADNDDEESESEDRGDEDGIELPEPSRKNLDSLDSRALKQMASTPALSGSIPKAIFDAAMKEFRNDSNLAENFFNVVFDFAQLSCSASLLDHILDQLSQHKPSSSAAIVCKYKRLLFGINPMTAEYPLAFIPAIQIILQSLTGDVSAAEKSDISTKVLRSILPTVAREGLDEEVRDVIESVVEGLATNLQDSESIESIVRRLKDQRQLQDEELFERLVERYGEQQGEEVKFITF